MIISIKHTILTQYILGTDMPIATAMIDFDSKQKKTNPNFKIYDIQISNTVYEGKDHQSVYLKHSPIIKDDRFNID